MDAAWQRNGEKPDLMSNVSPASVLRNIHLGIEEIWKFCLES
jgi:hypothetical protein